eukprot:857491-Pyramimonas_sp.AAC.1
MGPLPNCNRAGGPSRAHRRRSSERAWGSMCDRQCWLPVAMRPSIQRCHGAASRGDARRKTPAHGSVSGARARQCG